MSNSKTTSFSTTKPFIIPAAHTKTPGEKLELWQKTLDDPNQANPHIKRINGNPVYVVKETVSRLDVIDGNKQGLVVKRQYTPTVQGSLSQDTIEGKSDFITVEQVERIVENVIGGLFE